MKKIFTLGLALLTLSSVVKADEFSLEDADSNYSYHRYTVLNSTNGTVTLNFHQAACSTHEIHDVAPFQKKESEHSRGICLLKGIVGELAIDGKRYSLNYESEGTTYGSFVVAVEKDLEGNFIKAYLKHMKF